MYQAYLLSGQECSKLLQVKESCAFYPNLYSDTIKHAVRELAFAESNTTVTTDIQYKGTVYKKGVCFDGYPQRHLPLRIQLYSVTKDSLGLQCININDLPVFYPLVSYILDGYQVIPLKHSIVEK